MECRAEQIREGMVGIVSWARALSCGQRAAPVTEVITLYPAPFLLLGGLGIPVSVLGKGTSRGRVQVVLGLTRRVWCGEVGMGVGLTNPAFSPMPTVPPTTPAQSWRSWRHCLCELTQGGIPSWPLPHGPLSSDPQILVWPWAVWAVELPMPRSSP